MATREKEKDRMRKRRRKGIVDRGCRDWRV
jgi:hypothetical protein